MAFDLPTNFSLGNNLTGGISGIGSMFQYASNVTGGWFGTAIVGIIWLMVFGISAALNTGRAFVSASFIAFVFSIYFTRLGAVPSMLPFGLLIMVIIGFFWAKSERSSY